MEDSTHATIYHKQLVKDLMLSLLLDYSNRAEHHDDSKLESPEKELFDEYTPKMANCKFGSDEYQTLLTGLKPALDHHYAMNSHHPEHYENGINGMDLLDLVELICDWIASSKRNLDGNVYKSIDINKDRFNMSDQLCQILKNTVDRYFKSFVEE